jgi:hypothetical protein
MFLPPVQFEIDTFGFRCGNRSLILERRVNAKPIVIILEVVKFHFPDLPLSKTEDGRE